MHAIQFMFPLLNRNFLASARLICETLESLRSGHHFGTKVFSSLKFVIWEVIVARNGLSVLAQFHCQRENAQRFHKRHKFHRFATNRFAIRMYILVIFAITQRWIVVVILYLELSKWKFHEKKNRKRVVRKTLNITVKFKPSRCFGLWLEDPKINKP